MAKGTKKLIPIKSSSYSLGEQKWTHSTTWQTVEENQEDLWESAMMDATLKHHDACDILIGQGLPEFGEGDAPLDRLASFLDSRDQLQEPGELLLSAESTLTNGGSSPFYFLDLRPQGKAEDFSILASACGPTVEDSLVRSRLQHCVWDKIPKQHATRSPRARASFKHVAGLLGVAYSDILAANFIFARSRRFRAARTKWEQHLDCLPAHELIVETARPDILWVAGADTSALEVQGTPLFVSWRELRLKPSARVARGTFELGGRKLQIFITPDLANWDATSEQDQESLDWALEGLTV